VRIPVQQIRRGVQVDLPHDLDHPVADIADDAGVDLKRLPDLGAHPERGVERRGRVLGHVADPGAARRPQVARAQRQQVGPVQPDLARGDAQPPAGVAEQGQGHGGLARAGFADQAEHLAGPDRETDVAHHVGPGPADPDLEAGHLQPDLRRGGGSRGDRSLEGAHVPSSWPRLSISAASSGRRSAPIATRANASVKLLIPIVSSAISAAGTMTAHGFCDRPIRFS
jgi:hypothetical protein